MKRRLPLIVAALVAISTLLNVSTAAIAQSTDEHELLKSDVGTWDADCKMWAAPDADPMEFKAVEKNRLIDGGMWVVSEYTSQMGSMKFEGHGIFGYDPHEEKYVGTWIDNMNPSISQMSGTYDEKTKTLTMSSKTRNPETGKMIEMKSVVRYVDDNHKVFEMMVPGKDGKEWMQMEMKYTRRK